MTYSILVDPICNKFKDAFSEFVSPFSPYDTCINDSTLISSDDIREVPSYKLVQFPKPPQKGHCFDVDELVADLKSNQKNRNAYTSVPLWLTHPEFLDFVDHPEITPEDRDELIDIFYPTKLSAKTIEAITSNVDDFDLIGQTGHTLANDYSESFAASAEAISKLSDKLGQRSPLLDLKALSIGPVRDILRDSHTSCIHGIGNYLIMIYLFNLFELRKSGVHLKLAEPLVELTTETDVAVYPTKPDSNNINIVVYVHPDSKSSVPVKQQMYMTNKYLIDLSTMNMNMMVTTADEFSLQQSSSPNYQFWKNVYTEVQSAIDDNIINILL